jgi:transcriptional regulator with XRE-family HTH domain
VRLNPCQRFGARIKELRAEREITQEELAERVGIFRTYMSRIETGLGNPTLTTIHALADSLGVSVAELFEVPATSAPARTRSRASSSRGRVK